MTNLTQACPLCNAAAAYETVHNPYGKRFSCPTCGDVFIDLAMERYIAGIPEVARSEFKAKLSKSAQASGPNRFYVIREPKANEITGDGRGVARTSMITEWLPLRPS